MKKKLIWTCIFAGVLIIGFFVWRKKAEVVVVNQLVDTSSIVPLTSTSSTSGNVVETNVVRTSSTTTTSSSKKTTPSVAESGPPAQTGKYVVTYTDKGFTPKTIQIPRGQIVKFVNNSNTSLLIVADDQNSPLLNEINQPKAVTKGGVYTFDFTYAGIWAYHNASAPDNHGNIVVF